MATQQVMPIIHIYKAINLGKYISTVHYELVEVKNGKSQLTDKIHLSKNQECALSMPDYWLKLREATKWAKICLTGLFKLTENTFYGDTKKRTNLILFRFFDSKERLEIRFYPNYYTKNKETLQQLI